MARFEADQRNITVIVVYIPHQGRKLEPFQSNTYAELEKAIAAVSKRDCLIIAGDFNSRLERSWKDNNFMDAQFVGRWSVHNRDCPGGTLLRDLLHKYDLADVSTMFQPRKQNRSKQTNNGTWINEEHPGNSTQMMATVEEYGRRMKRGGTFAQPAKRPSRHPAPFVLPIQASRLLQHQSVAENLESGTTEKEQQRLQQPVQFPQLPTDAEVNQLVNNHKDKESDSDEDSDDNDAAGEELNDDPVYWREKQQQPIEQWLSTHPQFNVNHHSVNIKVAQLFQNTVHFGKCEPTLNQPVPQFLIQYEDGDYAPMSTGEFLNATVMYHRENRLRLSQQRRKPVDPPVLSAAAARLAGENVGAATWSEDLSEGVATDPVVIPPNFPFPTLSLDSTHTNQSSRDRYQVAWGPDESLSEVMGSTEPLFSHHAYDDDDDDCIHSSNNVTVHQAAKAKVVHTENNPTYRQMQQSPALGAIWQPLFHEWFRTLPSVSTSSCGGGHASQISSSTRSRRYQQRNHNNNNNNNNNGGVSIFDRGRSHQSRGSISSTWVNI